MRVKRIECLNLDATPEADNSSPDHDITRCVGDGCDLDFDDASYGIVFSNSVIEHVGNLGAPEGLCP